MDFTNNDISRVRKFSNISDGIRVEPWATQDDPGFSKPLFWFSLLYLIIF